jgi:hypothetical protein
MRTIIRVGAIDAETTASREFPRDSGPSQVTKTIESSSQVLAASEKWASFWLEVTTKDPDFHPG